MLLNFKKNNSLIGITETLRAQNVDTKTLNLLKFFILSKQSLATPSNPQSLKLI